MNGFKTYYLRVSERSVLPLEVHSLNADTKKKCRRWWLQDRHVQEIVQLLHDVILVYVESVTGQKQTTKQQPTLAVVAGQKQTTKQQPAVVAGQKQTTKQQPALAVVASQKQATKQQPALAADIVTGTSVRVGYMFKRRPYSQQCLVSSDCLTTTEQNDKSRLKSDVKFYACFNLCIKILQHHRSETRCLRPVWTQIRWRVTHCLISVCNQCGPRSDDVSLTNLNVMKEKLVVYAHQLVPGSPRGMSQLRKVLGDVNQSSSPAVSISSYFQKLPSSQTQLGSQLTVLSGGKSSENQARVSSDNQSDERAQSVEAVCSERGLVTQSALIDETVKQSSLPEAPPSEGRKHKIKNILQRGDIGPTKRKRKHGPSAPASTSAAAISNSTNKPDPVSQSDAVQRMPTESLCGDNVTISKVSSPHVAVLDDDQSSSDSVTVVSVAQVQDMQNSFKNGATMETGKSMSQGINSCISLDDKKSCVVIDNLLDDHKACDLNTEELLVDKELGDVGQPQSELKDGIHDTDLKQSGIVPRKHVDHVLTDSTDGHSEDSPKFRTKKLEKKKFSACLDKAESTEVCNVEYKQKFNKITDSSLSPDRTNLKDLTRFRFKRKVPTFSDSESDDCLPEIKLAKSRRTQRQLSKRCSGKQSNSDNAESSGKTDIGHTNTNTSTKSDRIETDSRSDVATRVKLGKRKVHTKMDNIETDVISVDAKTRSKSGQSKTHTMSASAESNFVKLDKVTTKSKRLNISKSFFTDDDSKLQPTLSFFMKKDGKTAKGLEKDRTKQPTHVEDCDVTDKEQVEDLTSMPGIKNETDVELRNEIRSLSTITELNDEHLRYLVRVNQKYLRAIFEGRESCERHQMYKQGGKSRRSLIHQSRLGQYSDEQIDVVMESLIAMFCKRHEKYLDYLLKVLLPEILIHIHSNVHGTSHAESEAQLAPWSVSNADEMALLDSAMDTL